MPIKKVVLSLSKQKEHYDFYKLKCVYQKPISNYRFSVYLRTLGKRNKFEPFKIVYFFFSFKLIISKRMENMRKKKSKQV